jgi:hypothetical protein
MWAFSRGNKQDMEMITPEEAERLTKVELERKKRDGQFSHNALIRVGPNNGLKYSDAIGQYYLIEIQIVDNGRWIQKKSTVGAYNRIVTIQDNVGKLTGREALSTEKVGVKWLKQMREYGFDSFLRRGREGGGGGF